MFYLYRNQDDDGEYGIVRAPNRERATELLAERFGPIYGGDAQDVELTPFREPDGSSFVWGSRVFDEDEGETRAIVTVTGVEP